MSTDRYSTSVNQVAMLLLFLSLDTRRGKYIPSESVLLATSLNIKQFYSSGLEYHSCVTLYHDLLIHEKFITEKSNITYYEESEEE